MVQWSAVLRWTGILLGTAGLAAALWWAVVVPGADTGSLGWLAFGVVPLFAVGVWLVRRRPDHPQARRLLLIGSTLAVNAGLEAPIRSAYLAHGPGGWFWAANLLWQYTAVLSLIGGVLQLASYPDGVVEKRWQRVALRLMWLHLLLPPLLLLSRPDLVIDPYLLDPSPVVASPFAVSWLFWLGGPLAAILNGNYGLVVAVILFVRFAQAGREQRARMRLLVVVTALLLVCYPLLIVLQGLVGDPDPVWLRLLGWLAIGLMAMIPVAVVIGVVRYRLFDIELVLRRSVVFAVLSAGIAAVYFGLAAAPGLALGDRVPVELAVLLTIVATIAFQPVRRGLERLADRLVFGERVNRYQLVTDFGVALEHTLDLAELLPRLAGTVCRGLSAPWVRVAVPGSAATAGDPAGPPALRLPLERGGEVIGHIECGPRDGGYDDADRDLLATLARQAATAIANVGLTARLAEQVAELGRSRARIVAAEDSERRRIERNIHDGAQQQVVALIMKLRLARNQVTRGDREPAAVLEELQRDAKDLLTDLRELAHGIHPPVLSDQGLVAAVEARADRLPLEVAVRAGTALRGERLGPEVEGAAYFVICEALTNVVKHAAARSADIDLARHNGTLVVRVHDDGIGLAPGESGHGLTNLRDRVEAIGGRLSVDSATGAGTTVCAELPVGAGHA
ncbi:sensor histidine kinase [Amycolatopsis thermophila]|uniref:histidine kinase n=1 Tax=Amycolatopsis thermophila TaxID=206084 RepID=A0ABU0EWQ7_9PSEU|nr:GAF domain-containing sensor histidine kinase [Amycolatopsis thermophila]MDQ0379708.1 signal transduction histidine kinase [Amycolatopsis thermophila]